MCKIFSDRPRGANMSIVRCGITHKYRSHQDNKIIIPPTNNVTDIEKRVDQIFNKHPQLSKL